MPNRNFDASVVARRLNDKVNAQNTYSNQYYGKRMINNPQVNNNSSSVVSSYHAGAQTTYSETLMHREIVDIGGIANFLVQEPVASPATVPDPLTNVVAVGGVGMATVTFTPPVDDGGSPIINYKIYVNGVFYSVVYNSPVDITGLSSGLTQFTVSAVNNIGESVPSVSANATVYASVAPNPPSNIVISAGTNPGEVIISFDPSIDNNGPPITGYNFYSTTGYIGDILGYQSPVTITDINLSGFYIVVGVVAYNDIGISNLSVSTNNITVP
jgi:hypothetical protein